jgi:hypothetical protein
VVVGKRKKIKFIGNNIMNKNKIELGKVYPNPYVKAFKPQSIIEAENDHEVSMAQGHLDYIIKTANELKSKLGSVEKDIPGWIQDHISKAHSYLHQANSGYHEYETNDIGENTNEYTKLKKLLNFENEQVNEADYQKFFKNVRTGEKTFNKNVMKKIKDTFPTAKSIERTSIANIGRVLYIKDGKGKVLGHVYIDKAKGVMIDIKQSVNEAKKYDIGSGYMGNGLTIWNRAVEKNGDYQTIAHITDDGVLTIRDKQLPNDIKKMLQIWADSMKKGNKVPNY